MPHLLNIGEIRRSLRRLQAGLGAINETLNADLPPFPDDALENMADGYRLVDRYVEDGIDLLSMGQSRGILELDHRVLFGDPSRRDNAEYRDQMAASEHYFYNQTEGGIGDLIEFCQRRSFPDPWLMAAGVYVRMMAEPQLFIEGNHRVGALMMSYVLLRNGRPPFVLSPDNARDFIEPSIAVTRLKRRSLTMLLRRGRLQRHFARFLRREADPVYLLGGDSRVAAPDGGPEDDTAPTGRRHSA